MSLYAWHNGTMVSGCLLGNDRWVEVRKLALASAPRLPCGCVGHCAVRRWERNRLARYFRHRQEESCAVWRQRARYGESFSQPEIPETEMSIRGAVGQSHADGVKLVYADRPESFS